MQMITLSLVSHHIFTFRKKSHVSGTPEGRDRYAKAAARTRGGEDFLQGEVVFSFPHFLATLPLARSFSCAQFAFSCVGNCKWKKFEKIS